MILLADVFDIRHSKLILCIARCFIKFVLVLSLGYHSESRVKSSLTLELISFSHFDSSLR